MKTHTRLRCPFFVALLALAAPLSRAQNKPQQPGEWVTTWASAQMKADGPIALAPGPLEDLTIRQIVHLSAGGTALRIRLSNAFGDGPLRIDSAHIAIARRAGQSAVDPKTDLTVSFATQSSVEVPQGADFFSDPVPLALPPMADLAVTLHLTAAPAQETSHPGSRATSFVVHGAANATFELPNVRKVEHWYFLSAVDVLSPVPAAAIAVLGDSITDGRGSTTDGNNRWPDILAQRLLASVGSPATSVLNLGIGGNRVLHDGLGPNSLARFDRDILSHSGVRTLVVLEGINDLGTLTRSALATPEEHAALVHSLVAVYTQMIERAHTHGIKAIGATIMPDGAFALYHPDSANEADRTAVNTWIRSPGHFDGVIDFDLITRDPLHPDRLQPTYDSGDHIHLSPAGYTAMGNAAAIVVQSKLPDNSTGVRPPR
ncbi:MAG: SGNH/GDSL hydrolase family protein [Acidobacteriaceae bacterium]